jgi:hypothetical protein
MKKRFLLLTASVLCLVTVLCLSGLLAGDAAPTDWKTLEIRCAQANVELADARLAEAENQDKLAPGTNSVGAIQMLKTDAKFSRDRLTQLEGKGGSNPFAPQIIAATDQIKALTDNYNGSLQANNLQPGSVSAQQLRRQQAEINVAKARLAAFQSLSEQPLPVRLEWQIRQLQNDIHALWARPLIQD